MERFLEAWTDVRWEPQQLVDGGDRFALLLHVVWRGSGGETEVWQPLGVIYTVRGGRVVRQTMYWEWDETLRAAELA
jgi:ketosteroid isomerase-like protein